MDTCPGCASFFLSNCWFLLSVYQHGTKHSIRTSATQGIKIGLPAELATEHTFLQTYVDYLLEYQRQCRIRTGKKDLVLPLAIMTSGKCCVAVS